MQQTQTQHVPSQRRGGGGLEQWHTDKQQKQPQQQQGLWGSSSRHPSLSVFISSSSSSSSLKMATSNNQNIVPPTNDTTKTEEKESNPNYHYVNGIQCIEKRISFPSSSIDTNETTTTTTTNTTITLVEATADAQDRLVDELISSIQDDGTNEENNNNKDEEEKSIIDSGDVYGAVLWPSSFAVANYLLNSVHHHDKKKELPLQGLTILELGAGTGLVSLVASIIGGATQVTATDYETFTLDLIQYASLHLNRASLSSFMSNGYEMNETISNRCTIQTSFLDITDNTQKLPHADIIVAADVLYEPNTGIALANRIVKEGLYRGSRIIIGDSRGRKGRNAFLVELQRLLPHLNVIVDDDDDDDNDCMDGEQGVGFRVVSFPSSPSNRGGNDKKDVSILDLDPAVCLPSSSTSTTGDSSSLNR